MCLPIPTTPTLIPTSPTQSHNPNPISSFPTQSHHPNPISSSPTQSHHPNPVSSSPTQSHHPNPVSSSPTQFHRPRQIPTSPTSIPASPGREVGDVGMDVGERWDRPPTPIPSSLTKSQRPVHASSLSGSAESSGVFDEAVAKCHRLSPVR